jgi:Urb2/Npa2 family
VTLAYFIPDDLILIFMKPATVRSGDVPYIWTILSQLLGGSETHDETTAKNVFHEIVAIANALIRLRRDLVLPTLPHLGMVLRQLVMTMRSPRAQLGGKQSKIVTDTFPSWINPSQPLGSEDAKALARLFATLTTKTIVRVYGTGSDVQKAESLGRPFGKHASYVLVAYIEAMNDSLCVVSTEVRKELYPGLFALCGMLSDSDRESLMLSALDSGGKTTMKMLWKEYEKQKYVGKG